MAGPSRSERHMRPARLLLCSRTQLDRRFNPRSGLAEADRTIVRNRGLHARSPRDLLRFGPLQNHIAISHNPFTPPVPSAALGRQCFQRLLNATIIGNDHGAGSLIQLESPALHLAVFQLSLNGLIGFKLLRRKQPTRPAGSDPTAVAFQHQRDRLLKVEVTLEGVAIEA